jgi:hypothetical protein
MNLDKIIDSDLEDGSAMASSSDDSVDDNENEQ